MIHPPAPLPVPAAATLRNHRSLLTGLLLLTCFSGLVWAAAPNSSSRSGVAAVPHPGRLIDPATAPFPGEQLFIADEATLAISNPAVTQQLLGRSGRKYVIRLRYPVDCQPFQVHPLQVEQEPLRDAAVVQPAALPPGTLFRLAVKQDGICRVTFEELVSAGLEPGELNDPDRIGLLANGAMVPLRVSGDEDGSFDPGDALEFWGSAPLCQRENAGVDMLSDPWSPWNIYYLYESPTPPLRMIEESGEIVSVTPGSFFPLTYFTTASRFESDHYFDRLVVVDSDQELDHYFFDDGTRAWETSEYQFSLPGIWNGSPQPVLVTVGLRGQSFSTPENPDAGIHRAQIYLNSHTVPELDAGAPSGNYYPWREQEYLQVTTGETNPIHAHYLGEENSLLLVVSGDTPAGSDNRVLLDSYTITYQRDLVARDDELLLTLDPADGIPVGELLDIVIQGFTRDDIAIYRDDGSLLTNAEIRPTGAERYRCHFQDEINSPVNYRVITGAQLLPVDVVERIDPAPGTWLTPATAGSKYLVIVPDSLLTPGINDSLQLWLDNHPGGFDTYTILPSSLVYDWFSAGRSSPYAIRDLLTYGLHYWEQFPRYLLLAGDGSDNQKTGLATGQPLLPIKFRYTYNWGATVTEHWFGQLTEDSFPDVLVGRLPASSAAELGDILTKLISYQNAEGGRWQNRVLFITGIGGVGDLTFTEQTSTLIQNWIPQRFYIERLLTDDLFSPFFGGTDQLLTYLDQGVVLASYNGHGGGAIWSDNNLFRDEDVARLQNGQTLPFITNFTCYINAFESGTTLGEELVTAPERGAIGTLGCSSLSFFITGNEFAQYFYHSLLNQPQLTVAEAKFNSISTLLSLYQDDISGGTEHGLVIRSLLNSMNILGDPAQQLHLPQESTPPALAPAVGWPGEPLAGNWDVSGNEQGLLRYYSLTNWPLLHGSSPLYHVTEDELLPQGLTGFTLASAFPDSCPGGSPGQVRVFAFSDDPLTAGSAAAPFFYADSLTHPWVWGTGTLPREVTSNTTFHFEANCVAALSLVELAVVLAVLDTLQSIVAEYTEPLTVDSADPVHYEGLVEYGTFPAGYILSYFFVTEDSEGTRDTTTTSWQTVRPLLADPWLGPVVTSPADGGALELTIGNQGNSPAINLPLRMSLSSDSSQWNTVTELTLPLLEPERDTVVTMSLPVIIYNWLRFDLDPDSLLPDADRTNNSRVTVATTRYYSVNSELGTHDGTHHTVIQLDSQTRLEILPEEMPAGESGVLELSGGAEVTVQPGLTLATTLYHLEAVGLSQDIPVHWDWLLPVDSSSAPDLALVDRWQGGWLRCEPLAQETLGDTLHLWTVVDEICGAVPGSNLDHIVPQLEVSVENQVLTAGGFVSRQPTFTLHASDPNGIDIAPDHLSASIDGVPLADSEIHLDPAGALATIGIALKPDLSMLSPDSIHTLAIGIQDLCGNRDSVVTHFRIATDLAIEYFGNYPNPFAGETLFIFNLTDLTDRVVVDIYTTAGQRIRRLTRQGPLINYAEIHWDGRDEEYRTVANGVYFYRITAWQGERKVTRTGKAARLR